MCACSYRSLSYKLVYIKEQNIVYNEDNEITFKCIIGLGQTTLNCINQKYPKGIKMIYENDRILISFQLKSIKIIKVTVEFIKLK